MTKLSLPRSAPEAQGVSSSAVQAFVNSVNEKIRDFHSFMLLRHGQVIAEGWWDPYQPQLPHMLFSLSKSFTSTAIGMLVAEGKVAVTDKVISFFPDDLPAEISPNLAALTLHDLLSMNTGHEVEVFLRGQENWVRAFLAHPIPRKPGTHFLYNTPATYMCSAILQKVTGITLLEYLRPRLFEPLGIEGPTWETCPRGINTGGYGLSVKTEDIAKFGQLYLQKGQWQGQQLVPSAWVQTATREHSDNRNNDLNPNQDWKQGYGYQFWRCRHNAYRGDGAFGQYCVVMPDQDAVLAITSGVVDMQAVLDIVWDVLLPALGSATLPTANAAQSALGQQLKGLTIPTVPGQASNPNVAKFAGKPFAFEKNEGGWQAIQFNFGADCDEVTWTDATGKPRVMTAGHGQWVLAPASLSPGGIPGGPQSEVCSSGAWLSDTVYELRATFRVTPFCLISTFTFDPSGKAVTCESRMNVGFGPTQMPPLRGQAA